MTTTVNPLQLGIGMDGLETGVTSYVEEICQRFTSVTYVEIGIALGQTLTSISEFLREHLGENWRGVGIELPKGYSFNRIAVSKKAMRKRLSLNWQIHFHDKVVPPWQNISVYLEDAHTFIPDHWQEPIHLALIDGCHCHKCCSMDFLLLEPFIAKDGIVMFHDFGEHETADEPRGHGPRAVHGSAQDLGLLDGKREGWIFREEIQSAGYPANGNMGVFQKVN